MSAAEASLDRPFDWEELLTLIADGTVIPIVGKDLLRVETGNGQVLLDTYLAERLAAALGLPSAAPREPTSLHRVAMAYLKQPGSRRSRVYSKLKEITAGLDLDPPEALRQLAAIEDFRLYVSTTSDGLLASALDQVRHGGQPRTRRLAYSLSTEWPDLDCDASLLTEPAVYQLFGRWSATPNDYAVTEEDVLEFLHHLQSEQQRPHRLFDEFRQHNLLFLGCGFPDWLARFFIRTVGNKRLIEQGDCAHFVVDGEASRDGNLMLFLRDFQAEIYPPGDAAGFVATLYEKWSAGRKPSDEAEPAGTPDLAALDQAPADSIFLSYSRGDEEAVQVLYAALRKAGIDVWFDRQRLRGGDAWAAEIKARIRDCALFVPVISAGAVGRGEGYFRTEWDLALERARNMTGSTRPFLVPVIVDDTAEGHPETPERFWQQHAGRAPAGRPPADLVESLREKLTEVRLRRGDRP